MSRRAARGSFDLLGAITGTGGIAALVYGTVRSGADLGRGRALGRRQGGGLAGRRTLLLAAFAVIEARGRHPLLPPRVLRDRDRLGANLIMLGVGTANFGVFFFLTLFVQDLLGYSALREGVAFLPLTAALLVGAAAATPLVSRIGARPLLIAGAAASAGGMSGCRASPSTAATPAGCSARPSSPAPGSACCSFPCRWWRFRGSRNPIREWRQAWSTPAGR